MDEKDKRIIDDDPLPLDTVNKIRRRTLEFSEDIEALLTGKASAVRFCYLPAEDWLMLISALNDCIVREKGMGASKPLTEIRDAIVKQVQP